MHFMLRPNDFSIRCYPFFNCRMCFSIRLINAKNPHCCGLFLSFTIKKMRLYVLLSVLVYFCNNNILFISLRLGFQVQRYNDLLNHAIHIYMDFKPKKIQNRYE